MKARSFPQRPLLSSCLAIMLLLSIVGSTPVSAELRQAFLSANSLSVTEIQKYLIVGFKSQPGGDAVSLQNGEFGADRQVLSAGGTSPTGASFPTINSVFDGRWEPAGSEAYLVHPIDGTHLAPWEGIDYSGSVALTSPDGQISVSGTDIFADLGLYDAAFDSIGIIAANVISPVHSISDADYFKDGDPEDSPTGQLPTDSAGATGVGFAAGVDLSALTAELEAWKAFIEAAAAEGAITQDIEGRNYRDGTSSPFVIELLALGDSADPGSDLAFTDSDDDGLVIIDVNRDDLDWAINDSDVIIDGPDGITAVFRIGGESKMIVNDSSILVGEGGIANDDEPFGAIFFKGDFEGSENSDAVFAGSNVVLNGVAFWELNQGTDDSSTDVIDIQNGQGCAQFIGSAVLHAASSRFTKCAPSAEPPGTIIVEKQTYPDGATESFSFTPSYGSSFDLSDGQTNDSGPLVPGIYSVSEVVPADWSLTTAACSDGSSPSAIDLEAGETVRCLFFNTLSTIPAIYVSKNMKGPDSQQVLAASDVVFTLILVNTGIVDLTGVTVTDPSLSACDRDIGLLTVGQMEFYPCTASNLTADLHNVVDVIGYTPEGDPVTDSDSSDVHVITTGSLQVAKTVDWNGVSPDSSQTFEICISGPSYPNGDEPGACQNADGDGDTLTWDDVEMGDYTVVETDPGSAWDVVISGSPAAVAAGGTAQVEVTNTLRRGTIIVEKQADPEDSAESFTFSGDAAGDIKDGEQIVVGDLIPGTYTAQEVVPAGWDLTDITCDDDNSSGDVAAATATFKLEAGETVKCTFTNTQRGTIIVEKQTDPDGSTKGFAFAGDVTGSIQDGEQIVVPNLKPGTYTAQEHDLGAQHIVPLIWDLTDITCDDDNSSGDVATATATFKLDAGETVKCTFTNTQRGKIIVKKQTEPDGAPDLFTFDGDVKGTITDGQRLVVRNLKPGTYTTQEQDLGANCCVKPLIWDLTDITCDDDNSSGDVETRTATFKLEAGETVSCTFTNTQRGKIIVEKQTDPDGAPDLFAFDGDVTGSIKDGERIVVTNLKPGTYAAQEQNLAVNHHQKPPIWDLTDITCDDDNSIGDLKTATATFKLEPGETVKCTFANTQRGKIIVTKVTDPRGATQEFSFSGDVKGKIKDHQDIVVSDLKPGTFTVKEAEVEGWDLTDITCDDDNSSGDVETAAATVKLEAGETVRCTFTNTQRGEITVKKVTNPGGSTQEFSFSGDAKGKIKDLEQIVVSDLRPGTYAAKEAETEGWHLTAITCNDGNSGGDVGSRTATFKLDAGEAVRCTFYNCRDRDEDGVCDDVDNCVGTYNPDQVDVDKDGIGDVCDACPNDPDNDADGDGVCGDVDNCPGTSNSDQKDRDQDGVGDVCDTCPSDPDNDADGDGICGDVDNCPATANPDQKDLDQDGVGDACDTCPQDPGNDVDGDGVCGDVDNCPNTPNPGQLDSDGDGIGDACEFYWHYLPIVCRP